MRSELGPIRGLVHGAGVLADRKIEDQTDEQFARVFETKVAGLDALLQAIGSDDLRALVLFSSSTARFGRTGQVAYAAANEVLNKRARRRGPGPAGLPGRLGQLGPVGRGDGHPLAPTSVRGRGDRPDPDGRGGAIPGRGASSRGRPAGRGRDPRRRRPRPRLPRARSRAEGAFARLLQKVFERPLDVASTPILRSHVMDGRPVLPMALILEWLAQGAMTRNPGMSCLGVDDLRLLKGVVLREALPETIRVLAGKAVRREGCSVVPVELRGVLADGREVLHARAEVVLGDRHPDGPGRDRRAEPAARIRPRRARSTATSCSTAPTSRGSSPSKGAATSGSPPRSRPLRRPRPGSTARSATSG